MPKVSVIMSVYNEEKYLREAIESILSQSFADFEFIIIDDASNDLSHEIILSYDDSRIHLLTNENNRKLPASLNRGLHAAQGNFIVRMDADDISLPERLAKQVAFMEEHPNVGAASSNAFIIDEKGKIIGKIKKRHGTALEYSVLLGSPLIHPAAIIRKSVIQEGFYYNENFEAAQDYDLWERIHTKYQLDNLDEFLLEYRIHKGSITQAKHDKQVWNACKIFNQYAKVPIKENEYESVVGLSHSLSPIYQAWIRGRNTSFFNYYFWRDTASYCYHWLKEKL